MLHGCIWISEMLHDNITKGYRLMLNYRLSSLNCDLRNYLCTSWFICEHSSAYFKVMEFSFHITCSFISRRGGLHCSHLEHQNRRANICSEHSRQSLHGILLARKQPWFVQFAVWSKPQLGSLVGITCWAVLYAWYLTDSALVLLH